MSEGKAALESHFRSGRFLAGAAKGRWRLLEFAWPIAFIEVTARDGRRFSLRFDCAGYPDTPPTAMLWNSANGTQLAGDKWPKGGRVSLVFNPGWKGGNALYIPCDRQSIEGHSNWVNEHPWLIWNPSRGLLHYVEAVWEILQSHELTCEAA